MVEVGAAGRVLDRWFGTAGWSRSNVLGGLLALLSTIWFFAFLARPTGPVVLIWVAQPVCGALAVVACGYAGRFGHLSRGSRRFWYDLAAVGFLVACATVSQEIDIPGGATGSVMVMSRPTMALYGAAVLVFVGSHLRLPIHGRQGTDRLTFWLDAATVMVSSGMFLWYFSHRYVSIATTSAAASAVKVAILLMVLLCVFAIVKMVLDGGGALDRRAVRLLVVATFVATFGTLLQPLIAHRPEVASTQLTLPVGFWLLHRAADLQRLAEKPAELRGSQTKRPYSVLPYVALVATYVLLVALASAAGGTMLLLAVASTVLTGLVVLRQLVAFADNTRLLRKLDHGATHDGLTGMVNRTRFENQLATALSACGEGRMVSIAMIDLDDFKEVNDTLGHGAGDELLVVVARRLAGAVRGHDLVARFGGDEFAVLMDGVDPDGATAVAERMLAALAPPITVRGMQLRIRASIGIADAHTGDGASELLRRGDIAMYSVKGGGGAAYAHYSLGMRTGIAEIVELGDQLRRGIAEGELRLLYQPMVDLETERLVGVEALVRWEHPDRGLLTPDKFLGLAERLGLVVPLGRWVLHEACSQAAAWIAGYGPVAPETVSVNIAPAQLREPGFATEVVEVLAGAGLPPDRLILEITENTTSVMAGAVAQLQALRQRGVRVALDDFGTGAATLTLLAACPVDELKLDRSFMPRRPGPAESTVAAGVLHLARALHLDVVAEGIETVEQAESLRALGYRVAQGYLFSRPVPAAAIGAILAAAEPSGRSLSA